MTAIEEIEVTGLPDGLIITGEVAIGFPPARTGYAAAAYGNAQPSTNEGTWVLTSYLVANAIVLPLGGWASNNKYALSVIESVSFTL